MTEAVQRAGISLARRLSLLTGAVIAACLLVVLLTAHAVLTRAAMGSAAERMKRGAREIANLAESGIRQTRARYSAAARDPAIRRALTDEGDLLPGAAEADSTVTAAKIALAKLALPSDSGLAIELWSANGRRIALSGSEEAVVPESAQDAQSWGSPRIPHSGLQDVAATDSLQFGRLYASSGRVYFWMVEPIVERKRAVGYIAQQRRLASNPQAEQSVRALAGEGVTIYYRNADGTLWSTLGGKPAPPSHREREDAGRATRGAHEEMLIDEAPIAGTPLVVTMESRISDVLATPRKSLRELLMVGVLLLVAGMGATLLIGRGIAGPIAAVADGAEAIARGEYGTRVPSHGSVEVARLAASFNHMANEIAAAQRALEQKTADAQSANRAKSAFLATVSHELRTPLNAIAGYTELLEMELRGPLTDAQRRDLARIRASGQHLLSLINGVLDLNRIERGQLSYALEPIAIDSFLADLNALVSPQVAAKSITLDYPPSDRSLSVAADREKLRQIILNLLANAIRHTPAGGRISLSSSANGEGNVEILIQDTGPGIPGNRRDEVFEPFVQLDRSLTQPQEGLGLGLAISRDLARGMNGDLIIVDRGRTGAAFVLTLPRATHERIDDVTISGETTAYRPAKR